MIIRGNTVGTNMSVEKIAEKIGGTGGGEHLIVTLDWGQYVGEGGTLDVASHSYEQIRERFLAGGAVIGVFNSKLPTYELPLHSIGYHPKHGDVAVFILRDPEKRMDTYFYVDISGYVYSEDIVPVTSNDIDDFATKEDIGDISAALEEIRKFAQHLIEEGSE